VKLLAEQFDRPFLTNGTLCSRDSVITRFFPWVTDYSISAIYSEIFNKNLNEATGRIRGPGKIMHEKNMKSKIM
jgi:hypothetical protein